MIENVLKWGKVVGQFVGVRGDDMGDEDENPEIVPMQGRITFTPRAKHALASNTPAGPLTVFMSEPITAELNEEGELTRNGAIGVKLPASDSAVSPNGFTYEVKFDLTFDGRPVQYGAFSILVPAASEAEPIDLTMVTPVRTESGKPITQGVGVQSMQIVGAAFVIQYTNGSVQNAPITGPIADSAAISQLRAETTANTEVVRALAPALKPVIFTVAKEIAENSPDARADLQAALNAAANGDDASYWSFLRFYAGTVHVAPGVYRISAPADGQPSIVVPRGVNLDFSDATLVFEYPSNMTTLWCGILQHSQAGVRVGNMVTKGTAPSNAHVYDAIRIYHGDNGQQVHGVPGSTISNFQGAAVRGLGTYVTRLQNIRVSFCSHGLVHGHSSGLVTDGTAPYTLPAGSFGQASGAARRPTDMWVQNVIFDSTKGDVIVVGAVGSADKPNEVQDDADQITGGNLYLEHVLIEGTPARAVVARELSQIVLDDVHLEEVGAPGGAMFDTDVVYGNIVAGPLRINITGQRDVTNLSGVTTRATPLGIFQADGFQSFKCHDVYLRNDLGELWFSGPEPWAGAWGEVSVERVVLDQGSTGTLATSGGLMERNTDLADDPRMAEAIRLTDLAKAAEADYRRTLEQAETAAAGTVLLSDSFEDAALWTASYGSWIATDAAIAATGTKFMRLPANNTNTTNGKPVHMYGKTDVPVAMNRIYEVRAKLRTLGGVPGDSDTFQVLLAKANGASQTYWTITGKVGLKLAGVNSDEWTKVRIRWTSTETATLRLGPQAMFLAADLLVEDLEFADVTSVQDTSATVDAARAKWADADALAVDAWRELMPAGAVGSGGGANMVTMTRAQYEALAVKDPTIIYMVTA